ncbi:coth protein-domain-containing protein [Gamsiella multidivaricata]|uniref:coth protein-domain-containing protein n=1 Tax=Gamsiella multidivaricata TaxID=101098 RepID=UPI0022210D5F|nr:coth protein-domain-containing protein [Gamsiella multidivaricata]KAG0370100.1 hypothetical protein BGZ54_007728 [Gamsiella multidivaricata]KAI7821090.1 coth protein-domain-containing protein [Gamsiella multidivaricata]
MRSYLISGLLVLASSALADVTYNVVGFPDTDGGSFGVVINGKTTPLTTTPSTFPLWSATVVGASASSGYRYVKLSEQGTVLQRESFLRVFQNKKAKSTANEFFLRQVTQTSLPAIPQVFEDVRPKASKAFDDTQIATIHLTADPAIFADMVAHPQEDRKAIRTGFRFISTDTVYSVEEVKVKVSGHGSKGFKKLSLRIKFDDDKGETFFDRPIIKLRSEVYDPTMIREKIYIDVLNSVGVKTTQGAWVRVYVNGKPYGFHLMVEDIEAPFLRGTVHQGSSNPLELGSLYQMGSHVLGQEATLQYAGPMTADYNEEIYTNKILGANTKAEPMAQLITFFKDLQEYDPTMSGGIKFWNSRLNLDGFLRAMAMEYLAGSWDAYWWKGNNYFMYFNPTEARWLFLPTDFDSTFSDGNLNDVLTTYKKFAARRLARSGKDHPLITKLIYKNKDINARFEQILLSIVNGVFNSNVLEPRINAYEKMIADEVKWDYSLDRSKNPGKTFNFTITDFHKSITGPVTGVNNGIKPWIKSRAKDVPKQVQKSAAL